MGIFDKEKLDLACPGCGKVTKKTIAWINRNLILNCSGCGDEIQLQANQFKKTINQVDKQISNLDKELKKMFK